MELQLADLTVALMVVMKEMMMVETLDLWVERMVERMVRHSVGQWVLHSVETMDKKLVVWLVVMMVMLLAASMASLTAGELVATKEFQLVVMLGKMRAERSAKMMD